MPQLLGIRIFNFKGLKDITLGKLRNNNAKPLTNLSVVIGKNGAGKSSIFEAFGFMSDCLKNGVEYACDVRGGFSKLISKGCDLTKSSITFVFYFKNNEDDNPITYAVSIGQDQNTRPYVVQESLIQTDDEFIFQDEHSLIMFFYNGRGVVWKELSTGKKIKSEITYKEGLKLINDVENWSNRVAEDLSVDEDNLDDAQIVNLEDNRHLAITSLGAFKQHPRIAAFRKFIENWYLSYFSPDSARMLPLAGVQKHISLHGENLANVVQYMQREHPDRFKTVLERISSKIPGIEKIDTETTSDGRLLLKFYSQGFEEPFYAQQMSDGTLKLFTYLLLLEDPEPYSLICIEEPENGLYHKLLSMLACEFREYALRSNNKSQVFITTHQPYLVNALDPDEVWILEKQADGFSTISRASNNELVKNLADEGVELGSLWNSDYLDDN